MPGSAGSTTCARCDSCPSIPYDPRPTQLEPAAELLEYRDRRTKVLEPALLITPRGVKLPPHLEDHAFPVRHVRPSGFLEGFLYKDSGFVVGYRQLAIGRRDDGRFPARSAIEIQPLTKL